MVLQPLLYTKSAHWAEQPRSPRHAGGSMAVPMIARLSTVNLLQHVIAVVNTLPELRAPSYVQSECWQVAYDRTWVDPALL